MYIGKKDNSSLIEDQAQIDAIEEFATNTRELLRQSRAKRQLSSIAKHLKK
jgi:hypothetical protein